uniref:Uncharacterized protein n=1 Tax=Arundo donax TaxID=35708 RepID=A0A0A8YBW3_ARUDO
MFSTKQSTDYKEKKAYSTLIKGVYAWIMLACHRHSCAQACRAHHQFRDNMCIFSSLAASHFSLQPTLRLRLHQPRHLKRMQLWDPPGSIEEASASSV